MDREQTNGPEEPAVAEARPVSGRNAIFRHPDLFVTLSIVVLFATIFVGGNFWWPVFVGGILIAGLGYVCVRTARSVSS